MIILKSTYASLLTRIHFSRTTHVARTKRGMNDGGGGSVECAAWMPCAGADVTERDCPVICVLATDLGRLGGIQREPIELCSAHPA